MFHPYVQLALVLLWMFVTGNAIAQSSAVTSKGRVQPFTEEGGNGNSSGDAQKAVVNSVKLGRVSCMDVNRAFEMLGLDSSVWRIVDGKIEGKAGNIDAGAGEFIAKKPFNATELSFGFSVRSKWYQGIILIVDDAKYLYSRGHWRNSATLSHLEGTTKKLPGIVVAPDVYVPIEIAYANGGIEVFYDGKLDKERFHNMAPNQISPSDFQVTMRNTPSRTSFSSRRRRALTAPWILS